MSRRIASVRADVSAGALLLRVHGSRARTIARVECVRVDQYRAGTIVDLFNLRIGKRSCVSLRTLRRNYRTISDSEILRAFGENDCEDGEDKEDPYLPLAAGE